MDVAGFLDALCWGNQPAIADPSSRSARTSPMHSDRLAEIVCVPPNIPRRINSGRCKTVKESINEEMDAVVEELKEESADITEQSVLGAVIDEVQEVVQVTPPVFHDLVRTVAWHVPPSFQTGWDPPVPGTNSPDGQEPHPTM